MQPCKNNANNMHKLTRQCACLKKFLNTDICISTVLKQIKLPDNFRKMLHRKTLFPVRFSHVSYKLIKNENLQYQSMVSVDDSVLRNIGADTTVLSSS